MANSKAIWPERRTEQSHAVVSRQNGSPPVWRTSRTKRIYQARERLSEERRALPWVKVDKNYEFEWPDGKVSLAGLFKGRGQLVVQHLMFAPDWNEACKSCSFWPTGSSHDPTSCRARHHHGRHLARAAGKARRVQAAHGLHVHCPPYFLRRNKSGQAPPPISVFYARGRDIFHTYSCFTRLDMMNAAYHYLDLTPLGRHEEGLPYRDGLGAAT